MWWLQEIVLRKDSGEKMGLSIQGGAGSPCPNMHDETDEGIFVSKVTTFFFFLNSNSHL